MIARPPLALPLTALVGFLALTGLVLGGRAPSSAVDAATSEVFREYGQRHPGLVELLRIGTDVAAVVPLVVFGAVVVVALAAYRERRPAICCGVVTVLVPALWGLMHQLLRHPRPRDGFVTVQTNGFPSGHSANAAAAGLLVVLLLWPRLRRPGRACVAALAVVFTGFVGFTRVALLAHWPVDVVGGWLLALVVVPLVVRAFADSRPSAGGGRPSAGC